MGGGGGDCCDTIVVSTPPPLLRRRRRVRPPSPAIIFLQAPAGTGTNCTEAVYADCVSSSFVRLRERSFYYVTLFFILFNDPSLHVVSLTPYMSRHDSLTCPYKLLSIYLIGPSYLIKSNRKYVLYLNC